MPFYLAADRDVHPALVPGMVASRCCPGGISRSTRPRCYPSDMTEAEWAVCEPLLPAPAWLAGRGGRPATWCLRDIVDAIRYLTHNGPVWRALPADFPPTSRRCPRAGVSRQRPPHRPVMGEVADRVDDVAHAPAGRAAAAPGQPRRGRQ